MILRRSPMVAIAVLVLFVLTISACGSASRTTTTPSQTATSQVPSTATTAAPTTTTEVQQLTFEDSINPDVTYADLKNTPLVEKALLGRINLSSSSDKSLATEYHNIHNASAVFFIGDNNYAEDSSTMQGNKMNDVAVYIGSNIEIGANLFFDGFGASWGERDAKTRIKSVGGILMEITDKPFITIPNSPDVYVQGLNIDSGNNIYIRIPMSGSEYGQPALAYCHDLGKINTPHDGLDYGLAANENLAGVDTWLYENRDAYNTGNLTSQELAEFFAPRTVLYIFAQGDTDKITPKNWVADENNIPVARVAITLGNGDRVENLNSLFAD